MSDISKSYTNDLHNPERIKRFEEGWERIFGKKTKKTKKKKSRSDSSVGRATVL